MSVSSKTSSSSSLLTCSLAGLSAVTPPHGGGAWRRWRCTMTPGNIGMECPIPGVHTCSKRNCCDLNWVAMILVWGEFQVLSLCQHETRVYQGCGCKILFMWMKSCLRLHHVSGMWTRSYECQKPSTCSLTWIEGPLPSRWESSRFL